MKKILVELDTGRLCDIRSPESIFSVAEGLAWFDAPDDVAHHTHMFDGAAVVLLPPKPLAEVKAAKLVSLQASRNAAEAANVTVQGKTFSGSPDITRRFESMTSRLRRGRPSALSAIYQVDGSPVTPTLVLLEQIEDAIAANAEAAWNNYGAKVAAVTAATTVQAVEAITW